MRVAIHDGAVNGYNLATTDLGGGITSVHVTGNGDDYTFYYATHAVSGGVELDAFFTNTSGTLSDAFFTLLINPDGTYTFDIESVGLLTQVTVNGSDFGASSSGQPSLTSPDGQLVITGSDNNDNPLHVKASNNGIAVGDTGLQMDANEDLHLTFAQEQSQVSFTFTQWQSNGTADVKFDVLDGGGLVHEFDIPISRPPGGGDTHIVVQETSNALLIDSVAFDSVTQTYTLYVGSQFNQVDVDYNHVVSGGATFTVNNITYDQRTIPSTDLLFDVTEPIDDETIQDVRTKTNAIVALTRIEPKKHRPPVCEVTWGPAPVNSDFPFTGVVTNLTQNFLLFRSTGEPVRARLTVVMTEALDVVTDQRQTDPELTTRRVRRGDSVTGIAAEVYGDPALWRVIAEANNLDDPRRLKIGRTLSIPKLS
jgi:hypothetical protein